MSAREGGDWPTGGKPVAAELSERIRSILADAEAAAEAIRHEAQQDAQARRRQAETEALKVIEDARREAERFLAERINAVSELSDELLERGRGVVERLDEAERVRSELAGLVNALGETAARLANEVRAMPGPEAPEIASAPTTKTEFAEPDPPAVASPELRDSEPGAEPGRTLAAVADAAAEEAAAEEEAAALEAEVVPDEPEAFEEELSAPEAEVELEPEPEARLEPTPLEPSPVELRPVPSEPEPEPDAEIETEPIAEVDLEEEPEVEVEVTPEEAELIARVREAERQRADEPEDVDEVEEDSTAPAAAVENGQPDAVAEAPEPEEAPAEAGGAPTGPDQALGARLVALQMAVAGGNRGEVEAHLRRAFDLSEPGAILDDIFGSGTDADKRVVWPGAS